MKNFITGVILLLTIPLLSQSSDLWQKADYPKSAIEANRLIKPLEYELFELDTASIKNIITSAPNESEESVKNSDTELTVPLPNGKMMTFKIIRYSMMEAGLAARYPSFKTAYGLAVGKDVARIRFDWTIDGFHAVIHTESGRFFIDPFQIGDQLHYMIYDVKNLPESSQPFECHVEGEALVFDENVDYLGQEKAGDCIFRSYRLAVATSAEYSAALGAVNKTQTLARVVTTMNRVNGIFEYNLTVRMILIANTDDLFYYDAGTDPYTNGDGGVMLGENQANIDAIIGTGSYDIGHVFSTGGGGIASLNSPCSSTRKAQGVTGRNNPQGDTFDVDYVAHEMGHQFGGNHTQNNDCNRRSSTAMEPGSASTIMGYAGICSPNVQSNSDDYFHAVNLAEMGVFITGSGNGCDTPIAYTNNAPTVSAGSNYTIPKSTPFILTATGNDADGDIITYCWEQYNNEVATMPPVSTNTVGPTFRSLNPTTSSERYFPNLVDIIGNVTPTWEVLPSVGRTMDFRVTARDFHGAAGCTDEDDMTVTVDGNSGPFLVTVPNTAVTYSEGESVTVTWDVANTQNAPVSCSGADIFLSYNGGSSFATTLVANTSNDGSQTVVIPNGTTSNARIMVRSRNNIFFDISNTDFIIQAAVVPDYSLSSDIAATTTCQQDNAIFMVNTTSIASYSDQITLSASGLPGAANVAFSVSPVSPGTSSMMTISNLNAVAAGTYMITINGNSTSGMKTVNVDITVVAAPATVGLLAPADAGTDENLAPDYSWNAVANASTYELQVATDMGFANLVLNNTAAATTFSSITDLSKNTTYFWRVRGKNTCDGVWSPISNFKTIDCTIINGPSVAIPVFGIVNSTVNIASTGTIKDVDVQSINGTHTWISDLTISLVHPDLTEIILFDQICGDQDDFNMQFDDAAVLTAASIPCPPTSGLEYQSSGSLSGLNNKALNGNWSLKINDHFSPDGGQLNSWTARVCATNLVALPVTLLDFTAKAKRTFIELNWLTSVELNNAGFELQRSKNSLDFEVISWIDGNGTSNQENKYVYLDESVRPNQLYYYRLKQVDFDGIYEYSKVESVIIKSNQTTINVFPNPVADQINISIRELGNNNNNNNLFQLFSALGNKILEHTFIDKEATIFLGELPAGVYFYKISKEGQVLKSDKIVVE